MKVRISASLCKTDLGASSGPGVISDMVEQAWRILLNAATATWASAPAGSVIQAISMTGGVEMSALAIVTLPRETGATRAARRKTRPDPSGSTLVPAAYSTSGQSAGNWSRAVKAAWLNSRRRVSGTFSNATMPLKEPKGPDASLRNSDTASGCWRSCAWVGISTCLKTVNSSWSQRF